MTCYLFDLLTEKKNAVCCFEYWIINPVLIAFIYRENEQLSKYGDTKSARAIMLVELKKLIEANPLFRDKLQFPTLKNSRLRTLINQRYVSVDAVLLTSLCITGQVLYLL